MAIPGFIESSGGRLAADGVSDQAASLSGSVMVFSRRLVLYRLYANVRRRRLAR